MLLLDEPLSALDAKLRQHMLIALDQIHDKIGITFIYVTHDQQEALSVSDHIAVMDQGDVLQIGTPHEIYESPATGFVARFIGETNLFDGEVLGVEKLPKEQTEYMVELDISQLGRIKVTTVDEVQKGSRMSFTVRPEKVVISKEKPATKREDINTFRCVVEEPIYSGFLTKFFVKVNENTLVRSITQHARYYDEGRTLSGRTTCTFPGAPTTATLSEPKNRERQRRQAQLRPALLGIHDDLVHRIFFGAPVNYRALQFSA